MNKSENSFSLFFAILFCMVSIFSLKKKHYSLRTNCITKWNEPRVQMNELIYVVFIDLRFAVLHLKNYGKVTPRTRSKLWRSNQAQNRITTTAASNNIILLSFPPTKVLFVFSIYFLFIYFLFLVWLSCKYKNRFVFTQNK